jgi:predicted HAD superfamily Cof-like phosphohydrolase
MTVQGIQADVDRFMQMIGQPMPDYPQNVDPAILQLRIDLITEEFDETVDALVKLQQPNLDAPKERVLLAEVADGIVDLLYVAVGTASTLGIDLEEVWEAVQRSNMAKAGGPVREDGKRLKPDGWKPPNIAVIIREQIAEHDFADRSIK